MAKRKCGDRYKRPRVSFIKLSVDMQNRNFSVRCNISCKYGCISKDILAVNFNCRYAADLTASPERPKSAALQLAAPSAGKSFSWPRSGKLHNYVSNICYSQSKNLCENLIFGNTTYVATPND